MSLRLLLPVAAALAASACKASREPSDPMILVHSQEGTELGVSTEYGTVFLGRFARGGEIDVTAWFGDGPSLETSVVEPLGAGLFTAETEIRLPWVPLAFHEPEEGDRVLVTGRVGTARWSATAVVRTDPRVEGILLRPGGGLTGEPEQVGAGVFVGEEPADLRLLGLVSGRLRLTGADGSAVDYVTVVGPRDLWRIVAHSRELEHRTRWVYREDVL